MSLIAKIKMLFQVRKPVQEIAGDIKDFKKGYKTVSFWVALITSFLSAVAAMNGLIPATAAMVITTILTAIYNVLRGLQKVEQPGVTPVFQSSEFWMGILGQVSNAIVALQSGGINEKWLAVAAAVVSGVMATSQNLGANQPTQPQPK